MARPKKIVDVELLKKIVSIQCSWSEIEAIIQCDRRTLERRYAQVIRDARENGKISLRKIQFDIAMQGNVQLLIWLGKQYLDQTDKREVEEIKFKDKSDAIFRLRDTANRLEQELKNEEK